LKFSYKQIIQVVLSLAVAVWIFWFLYKDIKMDSLTESLRQASVFWISLSIVISVLAYWLRAWRWKMLIEADLHLRVTTLRVFWALMTGYLANLLVPRAGEVARCGVLNKTDHLPMGKLLGTVILERIVDLLFLISVMMLAFLVENRVFISILSELISLESLTSKVLQYLPLILGAAIISGIFIYWGFQKYRDRGLIKKFRHFLRDFIKGLISVRHLKNQFGFWLSSLLIWIIYFFMMYFVALAIPSTAELTATSVLMVMVMGSIGMVAPVQGGIGTFHALVAFILLYYGLEEEEGKIFAVIIHGTQFITTIILGMISLLVFMKIISKKETIISTLR
jgi:uncharacterized protein (TIRG00374 family)